MTAVAETEHATFYSWIENQGASTIVHISGGQKIKDSNDRILFTSERYVKFNMGLLHTDDSDVIAVMRRDIKTGANITEDREVYLSHVMPAEQFASRSQQLLSQELQRSTELAAENSRLRAQLEGQAESKTRK